MNAPTAPESRPTAGSDESAENERPEVDLEEFIDRHRDDLEALAEQEYPVSAVVRALLDRRDGGER